MLEDIYRILASGLLAAFGAMAREMNVMQKEKLNVTAFVSGCVIAIFMGVILYFVTDYLNLHGSIAFAVAGLSGWIGPKFLDAIGKTLTKITGINLEKKPENSADPDNQSDTQ